MKPVFLIAITLTLNASANDFKARVVGSAAEQEPPVVQARNKALDSCELPQSDPQAELLINVKEAIEKWEGSAKKKVPVVRQPRRGEVVIFKKSPDFVRRVEYLIEGGSVALEQLAHGGGAYTQRQIVRAEDLEVTVTSFQNLKIGDSVIYKDTRRTIEYLGAKGSVVLAQVSHGGGAYTWRTLVRRSEVRKISN